MIFDDNDTTARFFYLALLGTLIAWGLFLSQGYRLKQGLRDAAIWGLIFFSAVTAYGFKDPFMAQLYPNRAEMLDNRTVLLKRSADGAFHARVEINGTPLDFLVDTGASDLVLTRADAAAAGIEIDSLNFMGQARTANGLVSTAGVLLDSVRLGEITDFDVRARVNGGELGISLLGMSYLDRYRSTAFEGDTLILRR
ncbi:MAG: TIGR02281 family clan AA aspartic protease [Pseudomonadota bacterium]